MKVGGRRQLVIPPHLGVRRPRRRRRIAPGETLIFVVDLVDVSADQRTVSRCLHFGPPDPGPR